MKNILTILLLFVASLLMATSFAQTSDSSRVLDVATFAQQATTTPSAITLDVRTAEEFEKGHLKNAINFNWNDSSFTSKVSKMDKASPVFVYCLSGGRSAAAAKQMRKMGFEKVYEMNGGILKWRKANLQLESNTKIAPPQEITLKNFEKILNTNKKVLIDFYANWCGPCKVMEPYIAEIARDMADKIQVVRIDVDANPELAKALKIEALPVLHLYQNKKLLWTNVGYIVKQEVLKHL